MMFFRSKFTAFYNRDTDQGTEHFAGQRLGCWINTIPANGLVMIPEASAGCVCLFSIASTIVFEPRDDRMNWGVYSATGMTTPVQHMALNLGAPGDRRDAHGKLWLGYPRPVVARGHRPAARSQARSIAKGGGAFSHERRLLCRGQHRHALGLLQRPARHEALRDSAASAKARSRKPTPCGSISRRWKMTSRASASSM